MYSEELCQFILELVDTSLVQQLLAIWEFLSHKIHTAHGHECECPVHVIHLLLPFHRFEAFQKVFVSIRHCTSSKVSEDTSLMRITKTITKYQFTCRIGGGPIADRTGKSGRELSADSARSGVYHDKKKFGNNFMQNIELKHFLPLQL